tara:strand:+ start:143 stop:349 length:207 start_codon:yes stop_codon:yes gene_type:complete
MFLIFSLSFGALAYVGHKTEAVELLKKKNKKDCARQRIRSQQKEIKKKLRKIESKLKIRNNKNVKIAQ